MLRQQAYIQIVELLVICMKEYSLSQSTYLAPQGRDSFTDLYAEALQILVSVLNSSERHFAEGTLGVTPTQVRRQFYLAGLLSLTMLLSEQVNRIALKTSEPVEAADVAYLKLILDFLANFVEKASSTALVAAEKAGLITNLIKMLQVQEQEYLDKELRLSILRFLLNVSCLMPVSVLKEIN